MGSKNTTPQQPGKGCSDSTAVPSYDATIDALVKRIAGCECEKQKKILEIQLQKELQVSFNMHVRVYTHTHTHTPEVLTVEVFHGVGEGASHSFTPNITMVTIILQARQEVRAAMERIVVSVAGNEAGAMEKAFGTTMKLTQHECRKLNIDKFFERCLKVDYAIKLVGVLSNLCEMGYPEDQ